MSALIECTCDACGATASCRQGEKGPPGWFWFPIDITDEPSDEPAIALACSKACQRLKWRRVPARRPKKKERSS